jgi:hypothetical protein
MNRAYSVLEIKAIEEEGGKRVFRGLATTPTADRSGDIVRPEGAEFKLPIPLLWMHNSRDPCGWVTDAKVTKNGIEIVGEFANLQAPASLKERLDEYWAMVTGKLVRGLSIGFKPLREARIGETYSYEYLSWLWLELSPVTIPANGDCSITSIKSIAEQERRAATGANGLLPVVRLEAAGLASKSPGATGSAAPRHKDAVYLNR